MKHLQPLLFSILFNGNAHNQLGSGFVLRIVERCLGCLCARPVWSNGPAGEDLGYLGDVALRVTAIDPNGVKLHQLASVVFIQSIRTLLLIEPTYRASGKERQRADAGGIIKIVEHSGAASRG